MKDEQERTEKRDDDSTLATLLNLAGPSPAIPEQIEQRVYQKVRSEWQSPSAMAKRTHTLRWVLPFAMAATVLIAVLVLPGAPEAPLRQVGKIVADGSDVFVGDTIDTTGVGGVAILLDGDISMRIGDNSRIQVIAANEYSLLAGRVYIDTGDRIYADRHITIATGSGTATDIGTQFSVSYQQMDMSVAVREGRVDLSDHRQLYSAVRGEKLTLRPGQPAQIDSVSIAGPEWDWAIALAPAFELEGHSVLDFLKWASRETGLELVFENDDVRSSARSARTYGSISGLTPLEAVAEVLATTQFKYSIDNDTISVRR
jgi:hypothetical protein